MATHSKNLLHSLIIPHFSLYLTESTAYEFNHGLLTFEYPEGRWPDSRRDLLALGFMTHQDNAVVLRLDSANSNDYMELEIVSMNDGCSVRRENCFELCLCQLL